MASSSPPRASTGQRLTVSKKNTKNMTLSRRDFAAQEIQFQSAEVAKWLSDVLSSDQSSIEIDANNLLTELASGTLLCEFIEVVTRNTDTISITYHKNAEAGSFQARENIASHFTNACIELGVASDDIFGPENLEKAQIKVVLTCLYQLARKVIKLGVAAPPSLMDQIALEQKSTIKEAVEMVVDQVPQASPVETSRAPKPQIQPPSGPSYPRWVPDEEQSVCFDCNKSFTLFRRRHHCRACGNIFCSTCCGKFCDVPEFHYANVRVCEICARNLQEEHKVADITEKTETAEGKSDAVQSADSKGDTDMTGAPDNKDASAIQSP